MRRALGGLLAFALIALPVLPARAAQVAYVPATGPAQSIAVEALAHTLGWTFRRTADGAIVDDGSGPQTLRAGSRIVREDDTDVPLFDQPAVVRNGQLSLAPADAATLFHLQVESGDGHIALVNTFSDDATIREVPRPATPSPAPVATPKPAVYTAPALVAGSAGTLGMSVTFDGGNRIYQTTVAGNAGIVRGNLSSYGSDAVAPPVGIVTVGAPVRNVAFGSIDNPLSGNVIENGTMTGVQAHAASGGVSYDASSGRTIDGSIVALSRSTGATSDTLAGVENDGVTQAVLRHAIVDTERWGTLDDEVLIGERGAAAGIHARTRGKTFVDATASDARGTLPLGDGDAPTGAVVGEHLSATTTVTAGYLRAIDAPGSPTAGVTTRIGGLSLGTTISEHWTNISASFGGAAGYASFFASAGAQRVFGFSGGFNLKKVLAEMNLTGSGGSTSGVAQVRTNHSGLNLAAGFAIDAGAVRPLIGLVTPLAPALSFEVGLVPAPSGRPAVRIALLAGFRQARPRVAMFPVAVFVPDATRYGPLTLFVDGTRVTAPFAAGGRISVPAGRHTLYVESADHAYGSLPADVVASAAATVALPLLPQRSIRGTVRFGGPPDAVPPGESLQGIRVVLEPSGESVSTDAGGGFVFARGPYDPNATVLLDPASVPAGFLAPDAVSAAAGDVGLTLEPARRIEQVSIH